MKINEKIFKTIDGLDLVVKNRRSAVIFETKADNIKDEYKFIFIFDSNTFKELFDYLKKVSNKSWKSITLKEADSVSADYEEYYDKKLDNNGYLIIKENALVLERPTLENKKLYQFNKRKMESFLYDFKQILK